jgi:predicted nucleic acid-binding Zn ribbon protein
MNCRTLSPILRCSDCGSQMIELRGPVSDQALVRCGRCGAEASRWADFLSDLGVRVARQESERRRRRLH